MENYIEINKQLWNAKIRFHATSAFYNNDEFKRTKNSLNKIELDALGNVDGKSLLHLQCHFGQDTLSWQNSGAQCTDREHRAHKKHIGESGSELKS